MKIPQNKKLCFPRFCFYIMPHRLHFPPFCEPHPGWSSPLSWQAEGRPAGSWRTAAHTGWGGSGRKTGSSYAESPRRSRPDRARRSSRKRLHDDHQGPLEDRRDTTAVANNKKLKLEFLAFLAGIIWLMQQLRKQLRLNRTEKCLIQHSFAGNSTLIYSCLVMNFSFNIFFYFFIYKILNIDFILLIYVLKRC